MQLKNSETYHNLARSFAGECQAGMRYQFIAQTALTEGYYRLSDVIKDIAKNETVHAEVFFRYLTQEAPSPNIAVEAGYPFETGDLATQLSLAVKGEEEEEERIYPQFAKTAREEGFEKIAKSFEEIAVIEGNHKKIFAYLAESVKTGTLYKSEKPLLWICSECGKMLTATSAHKVCPVCGKEQGYVDLHLPFNYLDRNGRYNSEIEKE